MLVLVIVVVVLKVTISRPMSRFGSGLGLVNRLSGIVNIVVKMIQYSNIQPHKHAQLRDFKTLDISIRAMEGSSSHTVVLRGQIAV